MIPNKMAKATVDGFRELREIVEKKIIPVSYLTLYGMVRDGKIPHTRFGGRGSKYYIKDTDIEAFLASNRTAPRRRKARK